MAPGFYIPAHNCTARPNWTPLVRKQSWILLVTHPERDKSFLQERLDFIGLDETAKAALRKTQPIIAESIGSALLTFFEKVKTTPDMQKFFRDEHHMAGARNMQEKHWGIIAGADFNDEYVKAVRRVGQTHARTGLEPRWYIGGYALVIEYLIHAVVKNQWPRLLQMGKGRPEDLATSLSCLVKATMLDMDFAISIYLETLEDQRRRAEEITRQEGVIAVTAIGTALSKLAAKDLSFRMSADMPEAYQTIKTDFNAALQQLETAMQGVIESTGAIRSGTQEISAARMIFRAAQSSRRRT